MSGLHLLLNRYMSVLYRYRAWLEHDNSRPWYATVGLMAFNVIGTLLLAERLGDPALETMKAIVGLMLALLLIPFFWVTGRILLRDLARLSDRKNGQ